MKSRLYLASLALMALALFLSVNSIAAESGSRALHFYHTHTGKSLDIVYYQNGVYDQAALQTLNNYLADFRSKEVYEFDPQVFDFLVELADAVDNPDGTYEIISAFRSPETNDMLREKGSGGVAKKSQHMLGKAMDVRLRGTDTKLLRDTAVELQLGGVGYYKKLDFVHVDKGRVRTW